MLSLRDLQQEDFTLFKELEINNYANQLYKAGKASKNQTLEMSKKSFSKFFPEDFKTKNNYVISIILNRSNTDVGYIWYYINPINWESAFLYSVFIYEKYRKKGYARKSIELLNNRLKGIGCKQLNLHVFKYNQDAIQLYKSLDFVTTDISMSRKL